MALDPCLLARLQARCLLAVRECLGLVAVGLEEGSREVLALAQALLRADASRWHVVSVDPVLELWSAAVLRQLHSGPRLLETRIVAGLGRLAERMDLELCTPTHPAEPIPTFAVLPRVESIVAFDQHPWLDVILSGEAGAAGFAEAGRTLRAVDSAIEVLDKTYPAGAKTVRGWLRAAVGLRTPFGELRSCSTDDLSGLVAFSIDNPPVLLAEELLHETTHVRLARLLTEDRGFQWIADLPAFWSPFTDCVRPASRIVHGIAAYGAVLGFWEAVDAAGLLPDLAKARVAILKNRIRAALFPISACLTAEERTHLVSGLQEVAPIDWASIGQLGVGADNGETMGRDLVSRLTAIGLSRVERAEILAASLGQKVSRVSVRVDCADRLINAIGRAAQVCLSASANEAIEDPALGGFSNCAGGTFSLLDSSARELEVFAYVAASAYEARCGAVADEQASAGRALGIPACCISHFAAHWEEAVSKHRGDLTAWRLQDLAHGGIRCVRISWENNSVAGYFDGGLCWHFPCSLRCEPTQTVVASRAARLSRVAPELVDELVDVQRRSFLWIDGAGYGLAPRGGCNASVASLQWTDNSAVGRRLGAAGFTLSALEDRANWHVIDDLVGGLWMLGIIV